MSGPNAPALLFEAGGHRLAVFVPEVGRIVTETRVLRVPFAHPALAGLLDDTETEPVPVFDLLGLAGAARDSVPGARVALFDTDKGPVGLRLERLLGTSATYRIITDADEVGAARAPLPDRLASSVTALAEDERGRFFFFSPDAFLARLDLSQAARPGPVS